MSYQPVRRSSGGSSLPPEKTAIVNKLTEDELGHVLYNGEALNTGAGAPTVDLSDYYTKTEVDSKDNIVKNNAYSKTETDTLLNGKASVTSEKQTLINNLSDDGDPNDTWLMYKGQYVFRPELFINDTSSGLTTAFSSEHILQEIMKWSMLQDAPTSTVTAIDSAVASAHAHANKSAIDRLGVSGDNVLTIDGVVQSSGAATWSSITGKPTSTPTQIDQAVTDDHTHANKSSLDRLGVAANGNVTVDGVEKTGGTGAAAAAVSTIVATIAASGSYQTPMASEKIYNVWKVTSQTITPTANIATDGTKALESGHYLSNAAANVYDADANSTYWAVNSGTAATNVWVGYDFVTPKTLVQMTYDVYTTAYGPKNVRVEWSDDAVTWTSAYSTSMASPSTGTFYTIQFPSAGAHRYWRLFIVDSWTSLRLKTLTMHEGTSTTTKQLIKDADSITVTHDGTNLTLANGGASSIDIRVNVLG